MLTKTILLATVVLPFVMKGLAQGGRASDARPWPFPSPGEPDGGPLRTPVTDSPRRDQARMAPSCADTSAPCPDTSAKGQDAADYWSRVEHLRDASTRNFVRWLKSHDVSGPLTQRELIALYLEHCEYHEVRPLSERSLLNQITHHGVERWRPTAKIVDGKQHRPTLYRVKGLERRAAA